MEYKFSTYNIDFSKLTLHSPLIRDYCAQKSTLTPFYTAYPSRENITKQCLAKAKSYSLTQRTLLSERLNQFHQRLNLSSLQRDNLLALASPNTFTITTAHQTNIFSGPLYTIYKIAHCIRIANELNSSIPEYHFIPLFFLGSEDHDTEELNHIFLHGHKFSWQSSQDGAFGRRKVDKNLQQIIQQIIQELSSYPYFDQVHKLLETYKAEGQIKNVYLDFLQYLFKDYGLLFLDPDDKAFKSSFISIFEEDIFQHSTQRQILPTAEDLHTLGYKVQVRPRMINSFYLGDNFRGRIVQSGDSFYVQGSDIHYNSQELVQHLHDFPENFSPNVCLRGLFQEQLLPNVAYVGGGGEIAYWLELKNLFNYYNIPFPILWVRHSVMILDNPLILNLLQKAKFSYEDLLIAPQDYANIFVRTKNPEYQEFIEKYTGQISDIYKNLSNALDLDNIPLKTHIGALEHKHINQLNKLANKLYRHQKKIYSIQLGRQERIHSILFPNGIMQERYDNILSYYAKYGEKFIETIITNLHQYTEPILHFLHIHRD